MWCCCFVMVVVAVMSHPVASSHDEFLLNDCRVEEKLKFTTYDGTVKLQLTRTEVTTTPIVVIRQDHNQWSFILTGANKLWTWQDVELKLSEKPQVFINKNQVNATGSQEVMKKKMWEVEIKNAWSYARCEKKWPVLEIDSSDTRHYFEISRSEDNEKIKLLPTEATIIRLTVEKEEKVICREGDHVVVKDYDPSQTYQKLKPNTFTEEIKITANDDNKSIKIQEEDLAGVLYIVQCVDDCVLPDPSRPLPTSYYVMMGHMIFFFITTLSALLYIWKKPAAFQGNMNNLVAEMKNVEAVKMLLKPVKKNVEAGKEGEC